MKAAQVIETLKSGGKVAFAQFREHEVKVVNNGKGTIIVSDFVLVGRELCQVQRFAPDGTTAASLPPCPFSPGDPVVVVFKDWSTSKWGTRANGECHRLES